MRQAIWVEFSAKKEHFAANIVSIQRLSDWSSLKC